VICNVGAGDVYDQHHEPRALGFHSAHGPLRPIYARCTTIVHSCPQICPACNPWRSALPIAAPRPARPAARHPGAPPVLRQQQPTPQAAPQCCHRWSTGTWNPAATTGARCAGPGMGVHASSHPASPRPSPRSMHARPPVQFCFATFEEVKTLDAPTPSLSDMLRVPAMLAAAGASRITFVGACWQRRLLPPTWPPVAGVRGSAGLCWGCNKRRLGCCCLQVASPCCTRTLRS